MLKIKNLTKIYKGGKLAVDDIDLHVEPGVIYGFIGHNGAGKTTALKCATGLLSFEEGEIFIGGISIKENPIEAKRITAYVPDNPDLYGALTGHQYVNFISDIYEVPADLRDTRMRIYAEQFSIIDDLQSQISSYSHGMKQKIALIAALVHEPKLLILDEPFVGLDPRASHNLKIIFREMCDAGAAILFSTHVLEVAEKLCDKIAIIDHGKIIVSGKTKEVTGEGSLESLFLELVD